MTLRRRLAMGLSAALAAGAFTLTTPTPSSAEPVPAPLPAAAGDADGLAPGLTLTDLASRGEGDWLRYRIPSLTTAPNGDLLAFFDGRPSMNDLPSNITMLMRRSASRNGGCSTTWCCSGNGGGVATGDGSASAGVRARAACVGQWE